MSRDAALRARFERLRALRSAWGVLAPSGLSDEKQAIAETGRALSQDLLVRLRDEPGSGDEAALAALDVRLHTLESEMRDVALELPVVQLRSTLPGRVGVDRRGVLDLLDLILGAETAGQGGISARIPKLDYLITLLCTGGDRDAPLQDPVTLTPRLHDLCERSEIDYAPRLPALEAEFFAAADMHEADVREESKLRALRRRKMELGLAFFAPRVLRAIVTYNAALMRRIDEELSSSQDWGVLPSAEVPDAVTSVFETSALPKLAEALRRRAAGDPPAHDPLDRIAWCLDVASLTRLEREALLSASSGDREDLIGRTVLVGLLCRSAVVLDEEFPAVGIAPEQLSGAWIQQLQEALAQEVNRRIGDDDYDGACVLTDLKTKFLTEAKVGAERNSRIPQPVKLTAPIYDDVVEVAAKTARQIASRAQNLPRRQRFRGLLEVPWERMARVGAAALLVGFAVALVDRVFWEEGDVSRAELAQVSQFLSSGKRSGEGAGPAFVGTLGDGWSELDAAAQAVAADALTQALREGGVHEIMVYDADHRLRIQALGSQPPRVISAASD